MSSLGGQKELKSVASENRHHLLYLINRKQNRKACFQMTLHVIGICVILKENHFGSICCDTRPAVWHADGQEILKQIPEVPASPWQTGLQRFDWICPHPVETPLMQLQI